MKPNPLQIPTPRFRTPGCRHKRSCDCTAVWLAKENAKAWVDLLKPQPWPKGAGTTVRAVK